MATRGQGHVATAGTVTTAAQPAITSVGTLTGLTVSGALTSGVLSSTSSVASGYHTVTVRNSNATGYAQLNLYSSAAGVETVFGLQNASGVFNRLYSDVGSISIAPEGTTSFTASTTGASITGTLSATESIRPGSYTVGTLPAAGTAGGMIYVSNETGGAVIAFSDGSDWRRVTDRSVVA